MMGEYYENEALKLQFLAWATTSSSSTSAPLNPLPQDPTTSTKPCAPSSPSAPPSDAGSDGSFDVDAVINGLCDMFKEKNGRDPTDEEVKIWIEQITGATETGATEGWGEGGGY